MLMTGNSGGLESYLCSCFLYILGLSESAYSGDIGSFGDFIVAWSVRPNIMGLIVELYHLFTYLTTTYLCSRLWELGSFIHSYCTYIAVYWGVGTTILKSSDMHISLLLKGLKGWWWFDKGQRVLISVPRCALSKQDFCSSLARIQCNMAAFNR